VLGDVPLHYRVSESLPEELESSSFTHALSLHPALQDNWRGDLLSAMHWALCPGGQALLALPLRGSFQEIIDLIREYALKYDFSEFGEALEERLAERPTLETLNDEFEQLGFEDIDIEMRAHTLPFDSGRGLLEDPVTRLMIVPELRSWLAIDDLRLPFDYVREAIDKYWSEGQFELTLNVACVSARRS
jgi:hypothetical protein